MQWLTLGEPHFWHSGHALFWLWTGWTSGSGANGDDCGRDVTGNAFAESTHGGDRLYLRDAGSATVRAALLLVIILITQQSMLLLCILTAVLIFFLGIEVQKRRLGRWSVGQHHKYYRAG